MSGIGVSALRSGDAEGLAGVSAMKDIHSRDPRVDLADISEDDDAGESLVEDPLGGSVVLAEPRRLGSEGGGDGEVETADPAEEGSGIQFRALLCLPLPRHR